MIKKCYWLFILAGIIYCVLLFQKNEAAILLWINTLGIFAPLFFLLVYCLATIFFLPTLVLTIAGGALFGPFLGTLFNLVGATLGACCAFCISRYFAKDLPATHTKPRIQKLITGVERGGWKFVALLRLVPIIPFNIVNYGLGITRIKFSHYFIATLIFLIPAEIMFTYCGFAGMDMLHAGCFYHQGSYWLLGLAALFAGFYLVMKFKRIRIPVN